MIIGTTPTHTFHVSIDTSFIKSLKITYSQNGKEILSKRKDDCILEERTIKVRLSQEDTFLFSSSCCIKIQIRVLLNDGSDDVVADKSFRISADECLDREVLV